MMLFRDNYRFLSNFYIHPITYNGVDYKTTEHAYQALKFSDPEIIEEIINSETPGRAKRLGRKYQEYVDPDWIDKSLSIMYDINKIKFSDPELSRKLSEIDEPIVEGNSWGDTFWGVCDGVGENHLGKILERIKKEREVFDNQ